MAGSIVNALSPGSINLERADPQFQAQQDQENRKESQRRGDERVAQQMRAALASLEIQRLQQAQLENNTACDTVGSISDVNLLPPVADDLPSSASAASSDRSDRYVLNDLGGSISDAGSEREVINDDGASDASYRDVVNDEVGSASGAGSAGQAVSGSSGQLSSRNSGDGINGSNLSHNRSTTSVMSEQLSIAPAHLSPCDDGELDSPKIVLRSLRKSPLRPRADSLTDVTKDLFPGNGAGAGDSGGRKAPGDSGESEHGAVAVANLVSAAIAPAPVVEQPRSARDELLKSMALKFSNYEDFVHEFKEKNNTLRSLGVRLFGEKCRTHGEDGVNRFNNLISKMSCVTDLTSSVGLGLEFLEGKGHWIDGAKPRVLEVLCACVGIQNVDAQITTSEGRNSLIAAIKKSKQLTFPPAENDDKAFAEAFAQHRFG